MVKNVRKDFPILKSNIVYFDNSSTSLKPDVVIKTINEYYTSYTANAYRGDYKNSEYVSLKLDECRSMVSTLINCSESEVIFTSNCTDSINLISAMLNIKKKDIIVSSILEHHSNLLPWIEKGKVVIVPTNDGIIDLDYLEEVLKENKVKLVSITAASNVTGNIQPIKEICDIVHKYKSLVLLDCCQYIPHIDIDVKKIDCDFIVFSAHKMCGPTGLGVIYGKKEILKKCKIPKFGGGMVDKINTLDDISYKEIPYCFEAGTPQIESILGFSSAIRYYLTIGYDYIKEQNKLLNNYFIKKLKDSKEIESLFPIKESHIPIFAVTLKNKKLNKHYIAKILSDSKDICVSAGYQCCQPLYKSISEDGGIRISLQFYNTIDEIDYFFETINNLKI